MDKDSDSSIYQEIIENLNTELKFRLAEFDLLCENIESNEMLTQLINEKNMIVKKLTQDIKDLEQNLT